MTDPNDSTKSGDVPGWINAMMKLLLKTPGLQNVLGKQLALLSFTGRRSGRRYTIPISYDRQGSRVLMLTKKSRTWWRNFVDQPAVRVRMAGELMGGHAEAHVATDADLDEVVAFLSSRPQDAKAYGVTRLADGSPDPESVRALLPRNVLIHVDLH